MIWFTLCVLSGFEPGISLLSKANLQDSGNAIVGLRPDFLCSLVAPAHFMRLSLMKAAYAIVSGAERRKSGTPLRFRPRYALANLGHPSWSYWVLL